MNRFTQKSVAKEFELRGKLQACIQLSKVRLIRMIGPAMDKVFGHIQIQVEPKAAEVFFTQTQHEVAEDIWHQRLAHTNLKTVKILFTSHTIFLMFH